MADPPETTDQKKTGPNLPQYFLSNSPPPRDTRQKIRQNSPEDNPRSQMFQNLSDFTASGQPGLTGAILDRLTHHVHILEMNGESFRLRQSRKTRS